jgi:hypothetical protein
MSKLVKRSSIGGTRWHASCKTSNRNKKNINIMIAGKVHVEKN